MAQIISITSEALQATIRRLLPSQQGFGEDLQATNVVTPIIDLTPTAEGSSVPQVFQTALAFGSVTPFSITNTATDLASSGGFWRIFGNSTIMQDTGGTITAAFKLNDGSTNKTIWESAVVNGGTPGTSVYNFDFVVFLRPGDKILGDASSANIFLNGCYRQIADLNGNLINPSGFSPE